MRNVREQSEKILSLKGLLSQDVIAILNSVEEPGLLADLVASNLRLKIDEFQRLLEIIDPFERLQKVYEHLGKELEVSTVQARIQSEAKEEMSKSQREYFLREQMQAIRRELGEYDERHPGSDRIPRPRSGSCTCPKRPRPRPSSNWPGWSRCIPNRPKSPSSGPTWTGSSDCPGTRRRGTKSMSAPPNAF